MKRLWAPWRMSFILGSDKSKCIFCELPSEKDKDKENLILYRTDSVFVMMNRYPYNNGHLMVAPYEHRSKLTLIDSEVLVDLIETVKFSSSILEKVLKPEGMNIGINQGKIAGAGYEGHLHFHIVPRWGGDTNFMPVIGETKVMAEHLNANYDKLAPHFK